MSIPTRTDLVYAILAMDSYNRGYSAGIKGLEEKGVHAKIGNYSIVENISQTNWSERGFYALAYTNGSDVVISYRGTDNNGLASERRGGNDALNGYGLALGLTETAVDAPIGTGQVLLASDFYDAVAARTTGTIITTGHSLGGGLAGYVGALKGSAGILFDHMPFGVAVTNRAAELGWHPTDAEAAIARQRGYHTALEFLAPVRRGVIQQVGRRETLQRMFV